jgi:hypothetical protein
MVAIGFAACGGNGQAVKGYAMKRQGHIMKTRGKTMKSQGQTMSRFVVIAAVLALACGAPAQQVLLRGTTCLRMGHCLRA